MSVSVSVVIPVYNTREYLPRCLDSAINQTLQDIEIICVDDGSTDGSDEVLAAYAKRDARVHVVRQERENAGAARNVGMDLATGKWLYFMDSDDFADAALLERTLAKGEEKNADIVLFNAWCYLSEDDCREGSFLNVQYLPNHDPFYRDDAPETLFQISNPAPWTKLYRRAFLVKQAIRFQSLPNANDVYLTKMAEALAARITLVNERLYYYRKDRSDSIQGQKDESPLCFLEAFCQLREGLKKRGGLYPLLQRSYLNNLISNCNYQVLTSRDYTARAEAMRAILADAVVQDALKKGEAYFFAKVSYRNIKALPQILAFEEDPFQALDAWDVERKRQEREWRASLDREKKNTEWERAENERLRKSVSYQLGRDITAFPRAVRRFYRAMRRSGVRNTIKYNVGKLWKLHRKKST